MRAGGDICAAYADHSGPLRVIIAKSREEMAAIIAIRAAVNLGELNCDYSLEFDGNDDDAIHLLAIRNREPAGTLRLRFREQFTEISRLAIWKRHRGRLVFHALVYASAIIANRRKCRIMGGEARVGTEVLWTRIGGRLVGEPKSTPDGPVVQINLSVQELLQRLSTRHSSFGKDKFHVDLERSIPTRSYIGTSNRVNELQEAAHA